MDNISLTRRVLNYLTFWSVRLRNGQVRLGSGVRLGSSLSEIGKLQLPSLRVRLGRILLTNLTFKARSHTPKREIVQDAPRQRNVSHPWGFSVCKQALWSSYRYCVVCHTRDALTQVSPSTSECYFVCTHFPTDNNNSTI